MGGWRLYRVRYWFSAGRLHRPQSLRQDCCTRCILFRPSAERQCLVTYCIGQLFLLVSDQDGQVRFPLPCSVARQHMQLAHLRHGWPSFRHTSTTYQQFFISIDPSLSLANFPFAYNRDFLRTASGIVLLAHPASFPSRLQLPLRTIPPLQMLILRSGCPIPLRHHGG